ncbi:MAG: hypothetical protein U5L09_18985 [Bacteroidales bacterium]|nr:hypothetical protein [Bacteroidales bacterium]
MQKLYRQGYHHNEKASPAEIEKFQNLSGKGVQAFVEGVPYFAGNDKLMEEHRIRISASLKEKARNSHGTAIYFLPPPERPKQHVLPQRQG